MELLERLCRANGVSGFEGDIAKILHSELKGKCDQIEVDDFGNVIAKKGNGKSKVMLAAHMDEVGMMVKHITKEGFLHFVKIGGIDDSILPGLEVVIKSRKGKVTGIIGTKPPHLLKPDERKKKIKYENMYIDIGASNVAAAKKMVEVGDAINFVAGFGELSKDVVYGKAFDNRLGVYVLLKVMEKLPKKLGCTVYGVGTTQEEVGLKGARVAAYKISPDSAFVVDTTIAGHTPGLKEEETDLKLGKGPAITLIEASGRGTITHPRMKELLINAAKKQKIPYQIDIISGGMTDGASIHLTKDGIPTGVLSIPVRYIHSPAGVCNMRDVNNTIKLLVSAIKQIK